MSVISNISIILFFFHRCESAFNRAFRHGDEFARIVSAVTALCLRITRLTSRITARCTRSKFTQRICLESPGKCAAISHGRQSIESYSLPLHFDAENADADTSGICAPIRVPLCRFSPMKAASLSFYNYNSMKYPMLRCYPFC